MNGKKNTTPLEQIQNQMLRSKIIEICKIDTPSMTVYSPDYRHFKKWRSWISYINRQSLIKISDMILACNYFSPSHIIGIPALLFRMPSQYLMNWVLMTKSRITYIRHNIQMYYVKNIMQSNDVMSKTKRLDILIRRKERTLITHCPFQKYGSLRS